MDKIEISNKDIEEMLKWRDEHQTEVRSMVAPIKAISIICKESGYRIIAVREGIKLTLSLSRRKGNSTHFDERLGKLVFLTGYGGFSRLDKDTTKLAPEDKQSVFTVYCTLMAIMVYGNIKPQPEPIEPGQTIIYTGGVKVLQGALKSTTKAKKKKSIAYILHSAPDGLRISSSGSHASPGYSFNVRGHYRHYKSGKVVWIAEFTKGSGKKKKSKDYRMGSFEKEEAK